MHESDFINHSVTVMFCPPFWIALFEMHYGGQYSVAKVIIGTSEPTGAKLKSFFERLDYSNLPYTKEIDDPANRCNVGYKKMQKKIKHETETDNYKNAFTKAQIELKKQYCELKANNKLEAKKRSENLLKRKIELRQIKHKEKHKGH